MLIFHFLKFANYNIYIIYRVRFSANWLAYFGSVMTQKHTIFADVSRSFYNTITQLLFFIHYFYIFIVYFSLISFVTWNSKFIKTVKIETKLNITNVIMAYDKFVLRSCESCACMHCERTLHCASRPVHCSSRVAIATNECHTSVSIKVSH